MDTIPENLKFPVTELLMGLADDKFILGHREADWTGLGPILEEDIAFSAISQEEIAHAAALYEFIAPLHSTDADRLAFGRMADYFRCAQLVELSDDFDWALAIARQFYCDHFDQLRLERLSRSGLAPLAPLAARLLAEERCHVEHVDTWVRHLGTGTADSHDRLQRALNTLAPQAAMLFEQPPGVTKLEAEGVYPPATDMFGTWVTDLIGGRRGRHTPGFEGLLAELSEVYRLEPDAAW
jgi:ring-1,2-phenylacetyl-CoA epoxidase subunit PaaC